MTPIFELSSRLFPSSDARGCENRWNHALRSGPIAGTDCGLRLRGCGRRRAAWLQSNVAPRLNHIAKPTHPLLARSLGVSGALLVSGLITNYCAQECVVPLPGGVSVDWAPCFNQTSAVSTSVSWFTALLLSFISGTSNVMSYIVQICQKS